jgi:roadblock/LC7 domain-containing protein
MQGKFKIAAACIAAATMGAIGGHALMPRDLAEAATPYCMYDWTPKFQWLDVAGPAGQMITINGHRKGRLVLVDEDVIDEVDLITGGDGTNYVIPFNGLLDNVTLIRKHRHITVRVDGHRCVTT